MSKICNLQKYHVTRPFSVSLRLHRNLQRKDAAILQRIASILNRIQAIRCNQSRQTYAAAFARRRVFNPRAQIFGTYACHVFRWPLLRVEGLSTRTRKFPGHTHVMFFGGRFRASKGYQPARTNFQDIRMSCFSVAAFARRKRRKAAGGKQIRAFPRTPSFPYEARIAAAYAWRLWLQRLA